MMHSVKIKGNRVVLSIQMLYFLGVRSIPNLALQHVTDAQIISLMELLVRLSESVQETGVGFSND